MVRFRVLGIPVTIQPFFWLIAGLLSFSMAAQGRPAELLLAAFAVFLSILVHELGHALSYRKFGGQPEIVLHGMGGYATSHGRFSRVQHFIISSAGPIFGLGLFVIASAILFRMGLLKPEALFLSMGVAIRQGDPLVFFLGVMCWINLVWSLLNLVPVMPLDGGQILNSILGPERRQLLGYVGAVCGVAAAIYSFRLGFIFMFFLFGFLAYQNFKFSQTGVFQRPF